MNNRQLDFFPPEEAVKRADVPVVIKEKPALFLIDGMAMLYRAFFALQRAGMASAEGMPTGALYGFVTALLKIFETYKPHYLAAVFDSKEKTFRHDLFPAYKANRAAPPEELIMQLDVAFELLDAFNIPLIKTSGYEADDLIGTATKKFEDACRIYIVTPDKDLAQLVHDGVKMLRPGKNQNELELFGKSEIAEHFGVVPELFTQFLALTGDTSDNIPGAKGIGPKTASTLLNKYHSLPNIYRNLDHLAPKTRQSLEEFQSRLELVTQLVTIRTDLQIDFSLNDLACGLPDRTKLVPLLQKLGFKSIA
ncbi:MAG: DNA polymerase I, partial [Chlorobium sp.]|nr:DNA polymerase I [Chlorobium sp.]